MIEIINIMVFFLILFSGAISILYSLIKILNFDPAWMLRKPVLATLFTMILLVIVIFVIGNICIFLLQLLGDLNGT